MSNQAIINGKPLEVRFVHVRDGLKEFGIREFTVAYHYNAADNTFFAAFAYCSLKDSYNRKVGNAIALKRLTDGMEGNLQDEKLYLPIHNQTLFTHPRGLMQFAVNWGRYNA